MTSFLSQLHLADGLAALSFIFGWVLFSWFADYSHYARKGLSSTMAEMRVAWVRAMIERDVRIVDSQIIASLSRSVAFFASATIFVIGGIITIIGAGEPIQKLIADLPVTESTNHTIWIIKLCLLLLIFIYVFFKFAWSLRLFNYASISIGCLVDPEKIQHKDRIARHLGELIRLAGHHFQLGIRGYFFGLAFLSWLINPLLVPPCLLLVLSVLFRRQFKSRAFKNLQALQSDIS